MKTFSIKWKIFSYLLCFCALLLLILWLFQTVFLDAFYRQIKMVEIKSNATIISNNLDNQSLTELLDSMSVSQGTDYYIAVLSSDGSTIAETENTRNGIPPDQIKDLLSKIEDGEHTEYLSQNEPAKKNDFNFNGVPPSHDNQMQSIIYLKQVNSKIILIRTMISPVNSTVETIRCQLYFVTGIMLVLSIVLAILIAKRVSKPIEKLNNSAKVLAKGNYDVHFDDSGYKEIGELSKTLNIAATELNKVESLRRELMANISHDLRTPLSLIYGYAEVMHDFPEDITPEQTQTIMDETQRLSSLVSDVLDISNFEAGTQKLKYGVFNLTDSLKITTDRIAELVKKDGYTVSFHYDKEVTINADEIKVTQAYYNLLINAINYTGSDKTVTVNQIISADTVKIEICDSGEGIKEESLPNIWDRYYRIDKNHRRAVTGSGLGLSIVKKIIELHGGKYGVNSKPGEGSTFWFSLKIG